MQTQITISEDYTKQSSIVVVALSPKDIPAKYVNKAERDYIQSAFEENDKRSFHINKLTYQLFVELPQKKDNPLHFNEALRVKAATLAKQATDLGIEMLYVVAKKLENNALLAIAEGLALGTYSFDTLKTDKKPLVLREVRLLAKNIEPKDIQELNTLVEATLLARHWVNLPPNYLDAENFATYMQEATQLVGIKTEILNKKQIEALKMGGLLAVNQGSPTPPTFTVMTYKPKQHVNTQPIVLVGKGVVYDTGGLNIKPGNYMNDMKSDMGGGAAVAAAIYAAAKAQLPLYIISIVPATDNRPGQNAYASGDVIKMYDGQTVEVINTDAEGRMLLADALAYAKKYDPQLVIDAATLTGAAMRAIGKWGIAAMQVKAAKALTILEVAGEQCSERLVCFPMWEEYGEDIKSKVADMKHLGSAEAGHITAAKFLEKFTDYPYIHLDIAGPAFNTSPFNYRGVGASGVGVRLLFHFFKLWASSKQLVQ